MTFHIFIHRPTTVYCPPNTAEKDKIIFNPCPPPFIPPPIFEKRSKEKIPHPAPLSPLLSPPCKTAKVQPQFPNMDTSSDSEKYPNTYSKTRPLDPILSNWLT